MIEQLRKTMRAASDGDLPLGATGKRPEPSLSSTDQGEIAFAVAQLGGRVILGFGNKPVAWIGMPPEQAVELANFLLARAREANRIIGPKQAKPLVLKL